MAYSLNERAMQIIRRDVLPHMDALGCRMVTLKNGATVLDMGLEAKGGWMAAKAFTETGMGGLGELRYRSMPIGRHRLPVASIWVDRPALAELGAHDAFLYVQHHGMNRAVSGPIRTIQAADSFAQAVPYRDPNPEVAVCHIQMDTPPDEDLLEAIAAVAKLPPRRIWLLVAKTGCLTGAAQVCARNVEQSLPSLLDQGFPIDTVVQACGSAPIPAVVDDELLAYGRVNDGLIYGQETCLYVDCEDAEIERLYSILPFSKNQDVYGQPFEELFARCGHVWRNVPREWDAPCKVNFFNLRTGRHFSIGQLHEGVLERAFLGNNGGH